MYYILVAIALILVVVISYKRGHARGFAEADSSWREIEARRVKPDSVEQLERMGKL